MEELILEVMRPPFHEFEVALRRGEMREPFERQELVRACSSDGAFEAASEAEHQSSACCPRDADPSVSAAVGDLPLITRICEAISAGSGLEECLLGAYGSLEMPRGAPHLVMWARSA